MPGSLACRSITAGSSRSSPRTKCASKRSLWNWGKSARLMMPRPVGSSQCPPRIGKARRPVERQSSFFGLALQHGGHRPVATARCNAPYRKPGMSLKWQLHDMKPVANEDCGSMLPDVAERAKEVVPVQHRSRTHFACAHRCVVVAERSSQTPHANRLLIAADRYISERDRIDILAD